MTDYSDLIGVDVHTSYARYKNSIPQLQDFLNWMGVKWIRNDDPGGPAKMPGFFTVSVMSYLATTGNCNQAVTSGCAMVELTNEPNNNGLTAAQAKTLNQSFVNTVAGRVPIICSALGSPDATYAAALGPQAGTSYGAIHPYRGMRTDAAWTTFKNQWYTTLNSMAPGLPWFVTETGWHDYFGTGPNHGHIPTPDYIEAQQMLSDTLAFVAEGASRVFYYEGVDNGANLEDSEGHFGLAYPDWTPKQDAYELRKLITNTTTIIPVGSVGNSLSLAVNTTPITLTCPAGVVNGDLLLALVGDLTTTPSITPPAGWTLVTGVNVGTNPFTALYKRTSVGDTPGSTSWTWTMPGGRGQGVMLAFHDVDSVNPIIDLATMSDTNFVSSIPFGDIHPAVDNCYIIGLALARPSAFATQTTFTPPANYFEEVDSCTNTTSQTAANLALSVVTGMQKTAGLITGLALTPAQPSLYASYLLALQPAGGPIAAGAAGLISLVGSATGIANPPPPPPPPPDDTGEGSGAVRTYITGDVASARVDADMHLRIAPVPQDVVSYPTLSVKSLWFDVEDYLVVDGIPTGQSDLQCRMRTRCGIGAYTYSDVPPAPFEVNINATARWLPSDTSFLPGVGWNPTIGSGFALTCDPTTTPYLDEDYSFQVRGGDEVELPAVIFTGDAWMAANDTGWTANAFTVALVAVLHPNQEGPMYGLIESSHDPADEFDTAQDWGVRYTQGRVDLWSGAQVVSHVVQSPLARPVIVLASIDAVTGRLLVVDRQKSTRSFATGSIKAYDVQLYLGRTGGSLQQAETANMDVLEFAFWDRALDFDEMADVLHSYDSCYGVMG